MNETEATVAAITIAGEVAKELAGEVYSDGLKPTTQQAGEAVGAMVGLFNHVVLHPVKIANLHFKYKQEEFERDLKKKLEGIPEKNIVQPQIAIAGPALEALRYTFDTKEIREMYLNLLASSMNSETTTETHPAFVEIVRAMSRQDAELFSEIFGSPDRSLKYVFPSFTSATWTAGPPKHDFKEMPLFYIPHCKREQFSESRSIQNLLRLGLLSDIQLGTSKPYSPPHDSLLCTAIENNPRTNTHPLSIRTCKVIINDFGKSFGRVCLSILPL